MDGTGMFEAFQENQEKWVEVEAGVFDEYIRGEGTLSLRTHNDSNGQWIKIYMKEAKTRTLTTATTNNLTLLKKTSNLKQPPETIAQMQNYQSSEREEKRTINLTHGINTPPPKDQYKAAPQEPT